MIRGAIFDLDGTLLDSMPAWQNLGETYLRSRGITPRDDIAEALQPLNFEEAALYLIREYGLSLSPEEVIAQIYEGMAPFYAHEVLPKPGVIGFLRQLQNEGVAMCIATATAPAWVQAALSRLKMDIFFSAVFTCTEVGHGKNRPEIYRTALSGLGTKKEETMVFEDAAYAIRTAKTDGFYTAAVYDVGEPAQSEIQTLADLYIPDFSRVEFKNGGIYIHEKSSDNRRQ